MPATLPREMEEFWLDMSVEDPGTLGSIPTCYDDDGLDAYEVSTLVKLHLKRASRSDQPGSLKFRRAASAGTGGYRLAVTRAGGPQCSNPAQMLLQVPIAAYTQFPENVTTAIEGR